MIEVPKLVLAVSEQPEGIPNKSQQDLCNRLMSLIPQLLQLLPPVLGNSSEKRHRAALDEMLSGLVLRANTLDTLRDGPRTKLDMSRVEGSARLRALQSSAYDRFCKSIEVS